MGGLPPFPAASRAGLEAPAVLARRGYSLRPAADADLAALQLVYADTRADEMANVPWPPEARRAFLAQQFGLQHQHYVSHYAGADFMVVEHQGVVQGRYYLHRAGPEHLIIDISLLAAHRGQGLGRALIEASQAQARSLGHGMTLHVLRSNARARRLYEALGFAPCEGGTDTHQRMRWPAS
jgi:ribosomal protein S18 acetylase RimI-like enzyme